MQEAIETVLRKYVDAYYAWKRKAWESDNMEYRLLDGSDGNLDLRGVRERKKPGCAVRVSRSNEALLKKVRRLLDEIERVYEEEERSNLPRIRFDRHLYHPLPVAESGAIRATPPSLVQSETTFVEDLWEYWEEEKEGALRGQDVYLLRNLSRGWGIGFFEESTFYPDFVLWIKDGRRQRVVFVEPHGMLYEDPYAYDGKARLHERLPEPAAEIGKRSKMKGVELDSYIVSATG